MARNDVLDQPSVFKPTANKTERLAIDLYDASKTVSTIKTLAEQDRFDLHDYDFLLMVMALFKEPMSIDEGMKKFNLTKQEFMDSLFKLKHYNVLTYEIKRD
ncbi:hypothetical protein [Lactiplantibacillus daowaiensis]|uniref:Uncharacterized protein n=1 Tax=Lactiplantibacillus daowaiensis TaxID=2559918 RepID=A0ABW1RX92_9LACO|nr:hypothetical protein [Lactiplantibacillus daowaiensis]